MVYGPMGVLGPCPPANNGACGHEATGVETAGRYSSEDSRWWCCLSVMGPSSCQALGIARAPANRRPFLADDTTMKITHIESVRRHV